MHAQHINTHTAYTQHSGRQSAACALSTISKSTPVPAAVLNRIRGKKECASLSFPVSPSPFPAVSVVLPSLVYLIIPKVSYCSSSSTTLPSSVFLSLRFIFSQIIYVARAVLLLFVALFPPLHFTPLT